MEKKGGQSETFFLDKKKTKQQANNQTSTHQAIRQTHKRESFASAPITSGRLNTDTCTKRTSSHVTRCTDLGHPQRRAAAADGGTDDGNAHLTQRQEGGGGGHQPDEVAVVQSVSLKAATTRSLWSRLG